MNEIKFFFFFSRLRRAIKYDPAILLLPALFLFCSEGVFGQQKSPLWGDLPPGEFAVGYKIIDERDASRSFPQKSGAHLVYAARRVKISLWYPAQNSGRTGARMKFREYLSAMDVSAEAAIIETANSLNQIRLKDLSLFHEIPDAAITNLLGTETGATMNAPFAGKGKFPVVVLGQGLYYESPLTHTVLCEFLASRGFIVTTANLVGAHSPFVKLDAVDLEAAVRDLEFVASRARNLPAADKEKLAVVGFDMGGLSGLLLSMRNGEVDAFASLDSGIAAAHNLRLVKAMPDYEPSRLRAPLLHATHPPEELARFGVSEDTSFLDAARRSNRLVMRIPGVRHADFTSRPVIESVAAKMQDETTKRRRASFEFIAQNLLLFLRAHLRNDQQSFDALYNEPKSNPASKIRFAGEWKSAQAASLVSEDEFINFLYLEGAEKAAALFRRLRAEFPGEQVFREETLNQIGFNRLYRGAAAEAIGIFSLNAEAFPQSANVYDSLGAAYMFAGNPAEAIRNYRKSLEINPHNENAKAGLKRLETEKK